VVSGQLEDSLRRDIESYIEGRLNAVKQEIGELQSQLNESLNQLLDRQGEVHLDGSVASSIQEHLRAAHEEGIDLAAAESARAKASSDMAIVKAAISDIVGQQSQSEILKTLVNRAASFAPRVAFFVIKGDQTVGWRARGFEGTVGDNSIQDLSFSASADTVIGEAARSRATWSGGPHSHNEDHIILNRLGEEPPQRIVAVPLVVRERTVAVLYADSAGLDSEAINLEALETLVAVSAVAVELLAAKAATARRTSEPARTEHARSTEETPVTESAPHTYEPVTQYEEAPQSYAEEEAIRASEPPTEVAEEPISPAADEWASESQMSQAQPEEPHAQPETVESHADSFASSETPVSTSVSTDSSLGTKRRYGVDLELPVDVSTDEERRLHNDARRFARLLVSEIKLYNEQKVNEGRSRFDLYDRLKEYIDRSREMYDKRVKPEVARKYDYFHHELVTTLAEGDASKLGESYPGATVSV
jgi:hypothetical protein